MRTKGFENFICLLLTVLLVFSLLPTGAFAEETEPLPLQEDPIAEPEESIVSEAPEEPVSPEASQPPEEPTALTACVEAQPAAGEVAYGKAVSLLASEEGASVYYKTATEDEFVLYTAPLTITADTTITAVVEQNGERGAEQSFAYTVHREVAGVQLLRDWRELREGEEFLLATHGGDYILAHPLRTENPGLVALSVEHGERSLSYIHSASPIRFTFIEENGGLRLKEADTELRWDGESQTLEFYTEGGTLFGTAAEAEGFTLSTADTENGTEFLRRNGCGFTTSDEESEGDSLFQVYRIVEAKSEETNEEKKDDAPLAIADLSPVRGMDITMERDDARPLISARILNGHDKPTVKMTVNGKEVRPGVSNGYIRYQTASELGDGHVSVWIEVTRDDGEKASVSWGFSVRRSSNLSLDYLAVDASHGNEWIADEASKDGGEELLAPLRKLCEEHGLRLVLLHDKKELVDAASSRSCVAMLFTAPGEGSYSDEELKATRDYRLDGGTVLVMGPSDGKDDALAEQNRLLESLSDTLQLKAMDKKTNKKLPAVLRFPEHNAESEWLSHETEPDREAPLYYQRGRSVLCALDAEGKELRELPETVTPLIFAPAKDEKSEQSVLAAVEQSGSHENDPLSLLGGRTAEEEQGLLLVTASAFLFDTDGEEQTLNGILMENLLERIAPRPEELLLATSLRTDASSGGEGHVHSYTWTVLTPATCESEGKEEGICACGDTQSRAIPAAGHSFGQWQTDETADCKNGGSETRVCSVCTKKETRPTGPMEHQWSEWITTKQPLENRSGEEQRVCSLCGAVEKRSILPTDVPKTGESRAIYCWSAAMAVSLLGYAATALGKKKAYTAKH